MIQTLCVLEEAVAEAVETMAFMTLLPPDDEAAVPADCLRVDVKFSGPVCGLVEVLAPVDFCGELARNFAATDVIDEISRADALKEFCNVTCGLVLPRLAASASDVFDVTVPALREDGAVCTWAEFCGLPDAAVFNIDGFPVAARLLLARTQV